MNEKKKEEIRKEASVMIESFAKALDKVKEKGKVKKDDKSESYRSEKEGLKSDEEFREMFFRNVPRKDKDCIIAESKKW